MKNLWNKTTRNKTPKVKVVKKKKPRAKTRWVLIKELDAWFSRFIRLRDADKEWICSCITCGIRIERKKMHNCHFIWRGNYRYRRDENNCNAGCNSCNTYHKERHMRNYTYYMTAKYWLETVMKMETESWDIKKRQMFELQDMIDYYKAKVMDHPLYW